MKRLILLILILSTTVLLIGCGLREKLLAPPEEMEIPEGSLIAICTVEEDVFTYVYKDDGIYQYFLNDVLQGDIELENIQEQAYLNGESMANYLNITYSFGDCVINNYYDDEE